MTIQEAGPVPKQYEQFIGGRWVPAVEAATFESRSPFDDSVVATVPAGTRADAAAAVAAAAAAQPAWAALAPSKKRALFLRAAEIVEERGNEIRDALARETGAGSGFQEFQTWYAPELLRAAAGWVYEPKGRIIQSDLPTTRSYIERRPLGVVVSFGPWNAATVLAWRAVTAPLAAGNTVVLKPSELAPVTAGVQIAEILEQAGFPPGVINVVTHRAEEAAEVVDEFYENPLARSLYFTGSAATARRIAAKAGEHLKPVVLELGGYNHIVVLEDADLDYAVRSSVFSAFFHQGQICMCARKILVHEDVYDVFVEKFVELTKTLPTGDPRTGHVVVGPLINDRAVQTALARVQAAADLGATVLTGGSAEGRVVAPTVLADVPALAEASCEETFAPIVVLERFRGDDVAVERVNVGRYGLSFSVFTESIARGEAMARRIHSGVVHVNSPTVEDEAHAPNGGVKDSGWGRSGVEALDDFTELRWMTVEDNKRPLPF